MARPPAKTSYIEIDGLRTEIRQPPEVEKSAFCPLCSQNLPLSNFGICSARASGQNLYCKACIREKIRLRRRELREYMAAQKRRELEPPDFRPFVTRPYKVRQDANGVLRPDELRLRCNQPHERVLGAIYHGATTQKEIRRRIGISEDALGDALAELLLGHPQKVRTEVVGDERFYYSLVQRSEIGNSESERAA